MSINEMIELISQGLRLFEADAVHSTRKLFYLLSSGQKGDRAQIDTKKNHHICV